MIITNGEVHIGCTIVLGYEREVRMFRAHT